MSSTSRGQIADSNSHPACLSSRLKHSFQSPFVQAGIASITIFVAIFLFNWNIHDQNIQGAASLGDLVDIAGRQRMLSQRITKNLLLLTDDTTSVQSYTELDTDLKLLNQSHRILLETSHLFEGVPGPNEKSPGAILNQISPLISDITGNVVNVTSGKQSISSILPLVLADEKRLMPLLDQLNASLTTEKILLGSSHYKRQMMIESLFLLGIASILFCVVWYLLVQIQKRLMKSIWEKQSLIDLTDDLHEKKLHLSASISASFHETWSWTQRTGVFWCSESFWKVFGYQDESDFPKAHFDVFRAHIDPENRGLLEAAVQQNIQDGTPFDLELCAKNQQGAYRWIRVQGKVVNNMTDHTNYVAGTVEDIHEHKLAKLQLDHQDKLLKKVGKVAKIGGWHVNLKTDEVFWTSETYAIHEVGSDYQPRLENKYAFYTPEARFAIQSAEEWAI
ncbi:MAG: PAS domain-containing protein, partial [Gimesia sp.]|nr:PAS domain-containing protein [Gimesia sp.]